MEILLVVFGVVLWQLYKKGILKEFLKSSITPRPRQGVERTASDGHKIPAADDISCARFGHRHEIPKDPAFPDAPFIVHEEPLEGYINLNGKILKRSEADEYMRKHG
ncbi:MAG: hypothetical protein K6G16_09465 [Lachnospiraceae bacterium]|nr:hypothetical protein [Lachnospiraceae bacterium]